MIIDILKIWEKKNPNPKSELIYNNLYSLLVAVVLSAQSTDISVNKATKDLFTKYKTPEEILELGEEELKSYIKNIGLYNNKAKNIIQLSKILIEKYNSKVPSNFSDLVSLPGVGRKTANVVLNCWFGLPTMPVDTHILRLSKRLNLSKHNTPEKVEKDLLKIIPKESVNKAHHWMILHGRYICKSRKPACNICDIYNFCSYKYKSPLQ